MFIFYPGFNPKVDQGMFDKPVDVVVNTVNCVGTGKGSRGVAGQVFTRFDGAHKAYMKMCNEGKFFPGAIQMVELNRETGAQESDTGFWVFNVATKDHWKNPSDLAWVEAIAKKLPMAMERAGARSMALPPMGCGEGGLDWKTQVGPLVAEHLSSFEEKGIVAHVFAEDPVASFGYTRSVPPSKNRKGMPVFYPQPLPVDPRAVAQADGPRWFAGIGARPLSDKNPTGTPPSVLKKMTEVGKILGARGWGLRSGAAAGADSAFEDGIAVSNPQARQIFLPRAGFQGRSADEKTVFAPKKDALHKEAEALAVALHPAGDRLGGFALAAMTRNAFQLLGPDLRSPSQVVVCYTHQGKEVGGTGQSLRLATTRNIPVVNFGDEKLKNRSAIELADVVEACAAGKSLDQALAGLMKEKAAPQR